MNCEIELVCVIGEFVFDDLELKTCKLDWLWNTAIGVNISGF